MNPALAMLAAGLAALYFLRDDGDDGGDDSDTRGGDSSGVGGGGSGPGGRDAECPPGYIRRGGQCIPDPDTRDGGGGDGDDGGGGDDTRPDPPVQLDPNTGDGYRALQAVAYNLGRDPALVGQIIDEKFLRAGLYDGISVDVSDWFQFINGRPGGEYIGGRYVDSPTARESDWYVRLRRALLPDNLTNAPVVNQSLQLSVAGGTDVAPDYNQVYDNWIKGRGPGPYSKWRTTSGGREKELQYFRSDMNRVANNFLRAAHKLDQELLRRAYNILAESTPPVAWTAPLRGDLANAPYTPR